MRLRVILLWSALTLTVVGVGLLVWYGWGYLRLYTRACTGFRGETRVVYVREGTDFGSLLAQLRRDSVLMDTTGVRGFARRGRASLPRVRGRYVVSRGMTVRSLMNMLLGGRQSPVRLVVPSVRTLGELAARVCGQLELDSASLMASWRDLGGREELGADPLTYVIPNTYEVYWTVDGAGLLSRLRAEHARFWRGRRDDLARGLGLSRAEVYVLASIVQEEVRFEDEIPRVAGVYLNRLRGGIPLQACPTAKFAAGDMGIRRVLTKHTRIDSPYNTYMRVGLPPGPIRIASTQAIDGVLGAERHDYLYFCARADFSGRHHFSRTGAEHARHARAYQRALNARRIR